MLRPFCLTGGCGKNSTGIHLIRSVYFGLCAEYRTFVCRKISFSICSDATDSGPSPAAGQRTTPKPPSLRILAGRFPRRTQSLDATQAVCLRQQNRSTLSGGKSEHSVVVASVSVRT